MISEIFKRSLIIRGLFFCNIVYSCLNSIFATSINKIVRIQLHSVTKTVRKWLFMSNDVTFTSFFYWCHTQCEYLIVISNLLIIKGDKSVRKRKGLFQVPSFSDPPGVRTQDPILKRDVLYLLS